MNKNIIIVVSVVVVAGLSFYGGMKYGQSNSSADSKGLSSNQRQQMGAQFGGNNGGQRRVGGQAGGLINGEIISKDDKSITVKLRDGGSKIVFYSATTTVGKIVDGTSADLEVGNQVMVNGTTSSDGSVTAQNIQIRPSLPTP